MEKVVLTQAFVWYCPDCGKEIFENAAEMEFEPAIEAQIKLETGLSDISGMFMIMPGEVTCPDCEKSFESFDPQEEDDEGESGIIKPDTELILPDDI